MNVKSFKNLIKEAVAEAIREELSSLLSEQTLKKPINESISFTSKDIITNKGDVAAVREQLRSKIGDMFGMNLPSSTNELKIIEPSETETGEPVNKFAAFLADSAQNMTSQERQALKNLG